MEYSVEERIAISQEIEEEAIVLLKNNGVRPIKEESILFRKYGQDLWCKCEYGQFKESLP